MSEGPRLVAEGGPNNGQQHALAAAGLTLGRHPDNTVPIPWAGTVSRRHARITCLSGLFWLEDLDSKRGTFLMPAGGEERKLTPEQPALLLDGATLRLGADARFTVHGAVASQEETARLLLARLHGALQELHAALPHLPPDARYEQFAGLLAFEAQLREAGSEEELLRLVAEGVPTLAGTAGEDTSPPEPLGQEENRLPTLPTSLPEPDDPNRLQTMRNMFIADIRGRLPEPEDEGDGDGQPA
jgi:pSer/pThr/pTyr-binding forkhead associated (FHA) protein